MEEHGITPVAEMRKMVEENIMERKMKAIEEETEMEERMKQEERDKKQTALINASKKRSDAPPENDGKNKNKRMKKKNK